MTVYAELGAVLVGEDGRCSKRLRLREGWYTWSMPDAIIRGSLSSSSPRSCSILVRKLTAR